MTIQLGDLCRDRVSGWEGTATGRYEYLNGCVRWQIDGSDKDGKPEGYVFDEQQIDVLQIGAVPPRSMVDTTGGPRSNRPVER